jgi:hypothetical protein
MNLYDAVSICDPRLGRERLDPPEVKVWTDDDELVFAKWQAEWIASLWQEFAEAERDRFDEFCRDKFDAEHADDGYDDDLAYEQSREAGAP